MSTGWFSADLEAACEEALDRRARRIEPRIEEYRPEQRLDGIGEDRGTAKAATLQFAFAQAQALAQAQLEGHFRERTLVHERGAKPRKIAFGKLRKPLVEQCRHRAVEQRIAEELEPLVVGRAEAAVREGLEREIGLAERVTEAALQLGEVGDRRAAGRPARHCGCWGAVVTKKSRQADMLATSPTFFDQETEITVSPPSLVISRSSGCTSATFSMLLRFSNA